MPKTIRANVLGFCNGVSRAFALVERELQTREPVATLGPLVHNSRVVAGLEDRGVRAIDEENEEFQGGVVVRSHGVSPAVEEFFKRPGVHLIDGTCARVARIQNIAAKVEANGETLVVLGDRQHPEVRGIVSRCNAAFIVSNPAEVEGVVADGDLTVVSQTTFSRERAERLFELIRGRFRSARFVDTLCSEVDRRARAVEDLAERVDAIVVVGDSRSSNTRRLLSCAKRSGKPSWRIESVSEIPKALSTYEVVGIAAGASTPEEQIDEIESAISAMSF